jgi:hypothetical protein
MSHDANWFGSVSRERGHRRGPDPPARMTGVQNDGSDGRLAF